jgi:CRISPR/Cas system CSM-associated protein Csm3 (group 7 of RAMP superfamily)
MGRFLSASYRLTGDLVADTPIHIGGAESDLVVDMPFAIDGASSFYLPGASLTGAIRNWWARSVSSEMAYEPKTDLFFGRTTGADEGHASLIFVEDAVATGIPHCEIRDGVGIDRRSGTAADRIKYDRDVLPKGTRFIFSLSLDVPDRSAHPLYAALPDQTNIESRLGALVVALQAGAIRFGAAKTRGLGRLILENTRITLRDFTTREGLFATLKCVGGEDVTSRIITNALALSDGRVRVIVRWRPVTPAMVKGAVEGSVVKILPLLTADGDVLKPVIPGSSIKGALRSQSERIWRTIAGLDAPIANDDNSVGSGYLDQLAQSDLVEALYGSPGRLETKRPGEAKRSEEAATPAQPGLGAIGIDDCLLDLPISRSTWDDITCAETTGTDRGEALMGVRGQLDATSTWREAEVVAHVAIDRWTGGAADGFLYNVLEPPRRVPGNDQPFSFEITLDPQRLAHPKDDIGYLPATRATDSERRSFARAALALFLLTLQEFADGNVPLGNGANRGLGSIDVDVIEIEGGQIFGDLCGNISIRSTDSETATPSFERTMARLKGDWDTYWTDRPAAEVIG